MVAKTYKNIKEADMFSDNPSESRVDYENGAAEIPEWRGDRDPTTEYSDVDDDVRIWTPISESDERAIPLFMNLAKSALTFAQVHQGVPNEQAIENSCGGYAEQYISDVLHDSEYITKTALRTLMTKEIPPKISERWTPMEMNLFEKGLKQHRKNFSEIRINFLPQKTTMDLVEFYYMWKRSKQTKGVSSSRARAFLRRRNKPTGLIVGPPTATGMLTRGKLAATSSGGAPVRVAVQRKDVYTSVKRRRKSTKQARLPTTEA